MIDDNAKCFYLYMTIQLPQEENNLDKDKVCYAILSVANPIVAQIDDSEWTYEIGTMERFMKYDTDIRLILSATLACNVLAQSAQILWKAQRCKDNAHIASVESWSYKFLNEYADKKIDRTTRSIDLNTLEPLRKASQKICHKVVEFAESLQL